MFLDWKLFKLHLILPISFLRYQGLALLLRILPTPDPQVSLEDSLLKRFRLVIITSIAPREGAHIPRLALFIFMYMRPRVRKQTIQSFHGLDTVCSRYTDQQISRLLQYLFQKRFPDRSQTSKLPTLPIK